MLLDNPTRGKKNTTCIVGHLKLEYEMYVLLVLEDIWYCWYSHTFYSEILRKFKVNCIEVGFGPCTVYVLTFFSSNLSQWYTLEKILRSGFLICLSNKKYDRGIQLNFLILDLQCVIVSAYDDKELYNLMKERQEAVG